MRKINKQEPIASFVDFKANNIGANWNDFHRNAKEVFFESRQQILIEEQNCYCGYTEKLINEEYHCHLDHYIKKSLDSTKTFEWNNLIASCNDDDYGARYKDNNYCSSLTEYPFFFNPVNEEVQEYFEYLSNGEIVHKKEISDVLKNKVYQTITVFNLNTPALKKQRADLIKLITDTKHGGLSNDEIKEAFSSRSFPSVLEQEINANA